MSDKPKRLWFRFHLLTLVLMALMTGGIMWANLKHYSLSFDVDEPETLSYWNQNGIVTPSIRHKSYGWPCAALRETDGGWPTGMGGDDSFIRNEHPSFFHYIGKGILVNLIIGSVIVIGTGILSESLIRCREARKA